MSSGAALEACRWLVLTLRAVDPAAMAGAAQALVLLAMR
jgi:hypothetical protein